METPATHPGQPGDTVQMFTNPRERITEDYVSGRFG